LEGKMEWGRLGQGGDRMRGVGEGYFPAMSAIGRFGFVKLNGLTVRFPASRPAPRRDGRFGDVFLRVNQNAFPIN